MGLRSTTRREEQDAAAEQQAQMKAQRDKLRARTKPAPPPGTGEKTAKDSASNAAPRGQDQTAPKPAVNKARTRSTAKTKNWGPASAQRERQHPQTSSRLQPPAPRPGKRVGRRRHPSPSHNEQDNGNEEAVDDPEPRRVPESHEDRPQSPTGREDSDHPGGPAYAGRTPRASQGLGRLVLDYVEIPLNTQARNLSMPFALAQSGAQPPLAPTTAPVAPAASGAKRKRELSVESAHEHAGASASPPVSPKPILKKAKTSGKGKGRKGKGRKGKGKGEEGQTNTKVDGKGRAITIGGKAQAKHTTDDAARARVEFGDAWLAFVRNESPDPPAASPEAAAAMVRDKRHKATKHANASPRTPHDRVPANPFDFSPATPQPSPCPPPRRGSDNAQSNTASGAAALPADLHALASTARAGPKNAGWMGGSTATPKAKGTTIEPAKAADVASLFDWEEETPGAGPSTTSAPSRGTDQADDKTEGEDDVSPDASSEAKKKKKTGVVSDHIRQTAEQLGMEYLQRIQELAQEAEKDPEDFYKLVGWMHSDHYAPRDENMANMFAMAYSAEYKGENRSNIRAEGKAAYHAEIAKLEEELGRPPTQFEKAERLQAKLRLAADLAAKKRSSGGKGRRLRTMKGIAGKLTQQATSHLFQDGMTAFGWVVDTHALQEHAAGAVMFGAGEAFESLAREYDGNFHEMLDKMTRILRNRRLNVHSKWSDGQPSATASGDSEEVVPYKRRDWRPGNNENNCDGYWRIIKECLREDLARASVLVGDCVNKKGNPGDLPKQLPYRKLANLLYQWELELRGWPDIFKGYAPVMLSDAPKEEQPPPKPLGKDWTNTARDMWLSRKIAETRILDRGLTGDEARQVLRECNAPAILPIPQDVLEGRALAELGKTPMVVSKESLHALFTWETRATYFARDVKNGTDTRVKWQAWRKKGKGRAGESRLEKLVRRDGKPASLPKPRRRKAQKSNATVGDDDDVDMDAHMEGDGDEDDVGEGKKDGSDSDSEKSDEDEDDIGEGKKDKDDSDSEKSDEDEDEDDQ